VRRPRSTEAALLYIDASELTLAAVSAVSEVLLPLCCGLPPNCSQSYAHAGAVAKGR
jgi:hypothetical protein